MLRMQPVTFVCHQDAPPATEKALTAPAQSPTTTTSRQRCGCSDANARS